MDSGMKGGAPPAPDISEESADSELCTPGAATSARDDDDDDDAESCNCGASDAAGRGCEMWDDEGDEEQAGPDAPAAPTCWWSWLVKKGNGREESGRGEEEEEVASERPPASKEMEDRLFWEACLADGYP